MHWSVTTQHKDFFLTNHFILFEEIVDKKKLAHLPHLLGFNLSYSQPLLKQFIFNKLWARIFAELTLQKTIRFGFDLLFQENLTPQPISKICSIQGILGGVIFALNENCGPLPEQGAALFFDKEYIIPFDLMQGAPFLIVGFCARDSVYVLNENDPNTYKLKELGYQLGDRLQEKHHPLLYRLNFEF